MCMQGQPLIFSLCCCTVVTTLSQWWEMRLSAKIVSAFMSLSSNLLTKRNEFDNQWWGQKNLITSGQQQLIVWRKELSYYLIKLRLYKYVPSNSFGFGGADAEALPLAGALAGAAVGAASSPTKVAFHIPSWVALICQANVRGRGRKATFAVNYVVSSTHSLYLLGINSWSRGCQCTEDCKCIDEIFSAFGLTHCSLGHSNHIISFCANKSFSEHKWCWPLWRIQDMTKINTKVV